MAPTRTREDFDDAFSTMTRQAVGGFLVVASPLIVAERVALAGVAVKYRLPGMLVGIINSRKDGSSGGETGSTALDSSPGLESKHNATQIAHAPEFALRSPNAEPEVVPSASDAERPMARRGHQCAEAGRGAAFCLRVSYFAQYSSSN